MPPSNVSRNIRRAFCLPASAFTSATFLEREIKDLFSRSWLLVPPPGPSEHRSDGRSLAERVSTRGSRLPFNLLEEPLYLQRGWEDGRLRCFPNVCSHAWYPLVLGPGRGRTLTCAQHGRQFDCEGRFLRQAGFEGASGFPGAEDHLQSLPLASWGPFLFVCLGKPAAPFDRAFPEMLACVKGLPVLSAKRIIGDNETREVDGNWKQHAWNYMDKFHISMIHKAPGGLADAIDLNTYRTELYDHSALQWVYARNPDHGFNPALLPKRFGDSSDPRRRVFALWWFIWPNMTFNFYPWGLSINHYQPLPGAPGKTLMIWHCYAFDEAKARLREKIWLASQVDAEDVDAMSLVRRGVVSRFARRGRFSPSEEAGPHWFHRKVAQTIEV